MQASVWCIGNATQDHIFAIDALPDRGVKYRATAFKAAGGGVAANAAVAVARLGGGVALLARLGADAIGDAIIAELEDCSVECALVQRFEARTSPISAIVVDAAGERMIINHQDPAMPRETGWLPKILPPGVKVVLADTRWHEGATLMLNRARTQGRVALLDGDVPGCPPAMLAAATLTAFSADGLAEVTGTAEIEPGLRRAARLGDGLMMVTRGAQGVYWLEDGAMQHLPAFAVPVVDTLGAGDIFHGALALALAEGAALRPAVQFASAAAAVKVTRFGGRLGAPVRSELIEFLHKNT